MDTIVVFLPNWIGDVVMATPTLRALRRHFGSHVQLIGVMRPYVVDVLAGTTWLDATIRWDPRSRDRSLRSWSVLRQLRGARPDGVLLLTNSLRPAVLAWLAGARERVGFARNLRTPFLTRAVAPRRRQGEYVPYPVLDSYLELAAELGVDDDSLQVELATTPADEASADQAWLDLGLPHDGSVITFNTGGAFGAAKLWPVESFAALARRVARELDRRVLVLCGPHERDVARSIVREANDARVVSLAEQPLSLGLSKACVRRSSLLVTTDSGPRHFAAAFQVPAITLFGPTHVAWSENHHPRAWHLQTQLACQPCQQRTCPLGHLDCMRGLTVDRVWSTVAEALAQPGQRRAA